MNSPKQETPDAVFSEQDIRDAFSALANSETFSGSDRLIGFLGYVVNETLEGRAELIKGKSIAMDVYGYDPRDVENREGVVRVDGGRLRRKLEDYYNSDGANAPIRIELPKGGYVPVFHSAANAHAERDQTSVNAFPLSRASLVLAAACVVFVIGALYFGRDQAVSVDAGLNDQTKKENLRRAVLFESSPARLQAETLAQQGRTLIFPATDSDRLRAAMQVFEAAIKLDPSYAGGYAGVAQVAGLMAVITPDPVVSLELQNQAKDFAAQALEMDPELPWSLSAQSWASSCGGEYEAAMRWSKSAKDLAPNDPNILEFDALILLYNGQFQQVLDETARLGRTSDKPLPFVFQNARSAAFFHLGDYEQSIDGFEMAISQGAPLGPVVVGYLMAAYQNAGDTKQAQELSRKFISTWPENRVDLIKKRLFQDPVYPDQLLQGMSDAGWTPS